MEPLVAIRSKTFVAARFLATGTFSDATVCCLQYGVKFLADASHVSGATRNIIEEHDGMSIERTVEVISRNPEEIACPFNQGIHQ